MVHSRLTLLLAALAVCYAAGTAEAQKHDRNSYLGEAPPELVSEKAHWIGAAEPPTLAKLKDKVVWLHFNY